MKIAILGAECTGKSTLAQALLIDLQARHPGAVLLPETLRSWCDAHGRTPRAEEQAEILQAQLLALQAHAAAPLLLCDTTPLMTAVYSDLLFGDPTLYESALAQQRRFDLTLLTGLDLPWVADVFQRDGVAQRAQVDQRLREVLQRERLGYATVYGAGTARTNSALAAIASAQGKPLPSTHTSSWKWNCEKCSDPDCEHRLFRDLLGKS